MISSSRFPQGLKTRFVPPLTTEATTKSEILRTIRFVTEKATNRQNGARIVSPKKNSSKNASRSNDFRPDPNISTGSASLADYKKSGYDRGHLSPAADFAFDEEAMSKTFYMSNMSPQAGSFNRGIWKDLEAQVREWAGIFGRVYVVSGPILEKRASEYKTIGENAVVVPEFYYKVLLAPLYADEADKATPEDAESVLALAFIFPNEKCEGTLDDYETTVDEVEARTGLDFFSLLDDEVENEAESQLRRLQ